MSDEPAKGVVVDLPSIPVTPAASSLMPLRELTPREMVSLALQRGATLDVLTKLTELEERWERNSARRKFAAAISKAKAQIPPIAKNRDVMITTDRGRHSYRYADFSAIARVIDPILAEHGLSYRFRSMQTDRMINITCVLEHKDGHYEETNLSGLPDQTGSKNSIQAVGSTCTYLQRYTLVQMLGLAASDDDDGNGGYVTAEQVAEMQKKLQEAGIETYVLLNHYDADSLEKFPAAYYEQAMRRIAARINGKAKTEASSVRKEENPPAA